jgi:methylated-DNA-[protein]-cysteine S-methyltransferase
MYYSCTYDSPVGELLLVANGDDLVGLWITGQKYEAASLPEVPVPNPDAPVFSAVKSWLDRYFAGEKPAISELSLAPLGGEFRQGVWHILRQIPYGEVTTYGAIAKQMAALEGKERMSAQAVGGAVGHNPISIIVPCHRVVGANGSLTGYAGGLGIKVKLLQHEGTDMSKLFMPKRGTAL